MTDTEKLVASFNQWADETIDVVRIIPSFSETSQILRGLRIDTLQFAKANLARLAKEIMK